MLGFGYALNVRIQLDFETHVLTESRSGYATVCT